MVFTKKSDAKEEMATPELTKEQKKEILKQNKQAIKEVKKAERMNREVEK